MRAGTDVSGTGASTVRIPSADSVDIVLVVSASAGSLGTTGRYLALIRSDGGNSSLSSSGRNTADWSLLALAAASLAYLYFLVKHLAVNPCWSGLSSCFPGDELQV